MYMYHSYIYCVLKNPCRTGLRLCYRIIYRAGKVNYPVRSLRQRVTDLPAQKSEAGLMSKEAHRH